MKTLRNLLLISLILLYPMLTFGQRFWSVSISNSPRVEHRGSYIKDLFYYPISPTLISNVRFTDHLSASIGIGFHFQKDRSEALYFVHSQTPPSYVILRTYLYEIPVQLNYHFNDKAKRLDPFLKTSIRYSLNYENGEMYFSGFEKNFTLDDSYILWDSGAGINININEAFSIICQVSFGIGLKHYFDNFRYFEPLAGVKYTFKK